MSDSLQPHGLQHARLPCPSQSLGVCSNSCPLSRWCHPTHHIIYHPLLLCPWSFPASESFPMSRLFTWGGQSIGASVSIFPMNIQGWLLLGLTDWFPCCPRDFQKSSPAPQYVSINFALLNLLYGPTITSVHDYKKTVALTIWIFVGKSDVSVF